MTQAYSMPPLGTDFVNAVLKGPIPDAFEALRTCFAGATEPSAKTPYQFWADTTSGFLKIRNAANSAWVKVAQLASDTTLQLPTLFDTIASLSATSGPHKVGAAPHAGTIKALHILCETASTSSSGNEWQFTLNKRTNATPGSTVALFSGTVGTFTALGGVGGGAETVAHQVYVLTPNQNATVAAKDVLELTLTKVGTGTTLANVRAWIEME